MKKLTRRGEEMLEVVRDHKASGETIREYAHRIGMNATTLQWWRRQLREYLVRPDSTPMSFVEVSVDRVDEIDRGDVDSEASGFVVHHGEMSIEIPTCFEASSLKRLLTVVKEC